MATAEPLGGVRVEEHKLGRTVVHPGEVLRHSVYTRVVHWGMALFFILALLSGFALFTPWFYKFLAPLFGGDHQFLDGVGRRGCGRGFRLRVCGRSQSGCDKQGARRQKANLVLQLNLPSDRSGP